MKDKNDQSCDDSRRRLIKTFFGAAAVTGTAAMLPQRWTRPLVEAVVLPAHAQASLIMFGGAGLVPVAIASIDTGTRVAQWMQTVLDAAVPVAEAAGPSSITVCATLSGNMLTITTQGSNNHGRHQGTLNTDGSPGTLPILENLCGETNAFDAYVSGFDAGSGFNLYLSGGGSGPFYVFVPLTGDCPGFAPLTTCD
jgi:hypothetical protein